MKFAGFLLFFLLSTASWSQFNKTIIQFTDKAASPFNLSEPEKYLSAKAIERRNTYNILPDSSDLPVNPQYIQAVLAQGDVTLLSSSKWLNQILIVTPDSATISKILGLPFVAQVEPVGNLQRGEIPKEKFSESFTPVSFPSNLTAKLSGDSLAYGAGDAQIRMHNGQYLHNKNLRGKGITIAVLDAGFSNYRNMHSFDSLRLQGRVLGERDFVDFDGSVNEDYAHGMYCLSILAANIPGTMIGSAPEASYWLIRTENTASEYPVEEFNWVVGAEFADSVGADIISSSLGYNLFDYAPFNHSYNDFYKNATTVSKGATWAAKKGMIVTNSAGNEGNTAWKYIAFPADADSVCAIGSVNSSGIISGFSSYGYPGKIKPNVVSLGEGTTLMNVNDQPQRGNGTSYANPNLCGLIACLWQEFKGFNNMTILNAVYESSSKSTFPDDRYGFGNPDMQKAHLILKTRQNEELYGKEWFFVSPEMFTDRISVKLIGQVNGKTTITLQDAAGNPISAIALQTEAQEVYDTAFPNLQNLAGGKYRVVYQDSLGTNTKLLTKFVETGERFIKVAPVPISNTIKVFLKAPETGQVVLRVINVEGRVMASQPAVIMENNAYVIEFSSAHFPAGIYYLQYLGKERQSIRLLK